MFKKVFAVVLCLVMLMSTATISASVSADEAKTVVEGIRWFPCEPGRENDIIWEAECLKEGCGCQGFLENETTTGNKNFVDTVYGEDGSLTITRNGNDGEEFYWPRIRTLMLDAYPELDLQTANTLYFDFEATANWNILIGINGMSLKLSKVISDAAGVSGVANSDADGAPGTYKGSVNLQDAIVEIAAESGTESSAFAGAIQNMKTTYVPQISIFCVGAVGASVTMKSLFISTPDDTEGAKADYLDMGLIMGDDYYDLQDEPAADEPAVDEPAADEPAADEPADEPAEDDKKDDDKKDDKKDDKDGGNTGLIVGIIAAVVVIAAAVVVVIVIKKKKAA
ncbi:MAG: hypothetical protein IJC52_02555 [Clostridia bacterium]|nr:hypothetical protein [Clostridia bacterium]